MSLRVPDFGPRFAAKKDIGLKMASNVYFQQQQSTSAKVQAGNNLDHISKLDIDQVPPFVRQTCIACTLGESWNNKNDLKRMVDNGMNTIRLCMNKRSRESILETIKTVREIEKEANYSPLVAIALDFSTPVSFIGLINGDKNGKIIVNDGDTLILTTDNKYKNNSTAENLWFDVSSFPKDVRSVEERDLLFIGDGTVQLVVLSSDGDKINCLVEQGGELYSSKRVRIINDKHHPKVLSEDYLSGLRFAVEADVDFVFTSWSYNDNLLNAAREVLGKQIRLFAKIETREAYENLNSVMKASDGIIVGRGALSLAFPPTRTFVLQKNIIARCNVDQKPVFVITQLLKSMRFQARPTRAEASDVANSVLDGTDGLVLTSETSKSFNPILALRAMHNICREAETAILHSSVQVDLIHARDQYRTGLMDAMNTVSFAAVEGVCRADIAAIIVVTVSGASAAAIANCRPSCPVVAIMRSPDLARKQHANRGVHPFVCQTKPLEDWAEDMDVQINAGIDFAKKREFVKEGNHIAIVTGWASGSGTTNTVRMYQVPKSGDTLCVVRSSQNIFHY